MQPLQFDGKKWPLFWLIKYFVLTRNKCKSLRANGLYRWPMVLFIQIRSRLTGIISRSTTAVTNNMVIGIPINAYKIQKNFPSGDNGVWCPYPEIITVIFWGARLTPLEFTYCSDDSTREKERLSKTPRWNRASISSNTHSTIISSDNLIH